MAQSWRKAHHTYTVVDIEEEHGFLIFVRHFVVGVECEWESVMGTGRSDGLFRTSALAHIYCPSRSIAFLPAGVSLHKPITVDLNSTEHIACICTVYRDIVIAFARWVLGTEL